MRQCVVKIREQTTLELKSLLLNRAEETYKTLVAMRKLINTLKTLKQETQISL